jgi:hypothetical protein
MLRLSVILTWDSLSSLRGDLDMFMIWGRSRMLVPDSVTSFHIHNQVPNLILNTYCYGLHLLWLNTLPWIGKFYLVDSGYPNQLGYLAPYRGQKYHFQEFHQCTMPRGKKEHFNYTHSRLRNVIERFFGVLKNKWRILFKVPSYPLRKQTKIIVACMALHNFIRES